jgi:hypothetical protein
LFRVGLAQLFLGVALEQGIIYLAFVVYFSFSGEAAGKLLLLGSRR